MSDATGTLYRVTLFQTLLGQECLNVFHYIKKASGTGSGSQIALYFQETVLPKINAVQVSNITNVKINVQQLVGGFLVYDYALTGVGAVNNSEAMPSYVCYSFRFPRVSSLVKSGHKRIAGVPETYVNSGKLVSGFASQIADLASALASELKVPAGDPPVLTNTGFAPSIVSFQLGGQPRNSPVADFIATAQFGGITSQVSRKIKNNV